MNRVSIPNHCMFFILVLLSALFSSCDDDRLSEAIQGTWNTQYNLTSNDQSVDSVNETLVFKKGNNDDTSGTLVETKRYISNPSLTPIIVETCYYYTFSVLAMDSVSYKFLFF